MKLLVKRDKTYLVKCAGRMGYFSDAPNDFEQVSIIPHNEVMKIGSSSLEGKLIASQRDWRSSQQHLMQHSPNRLHALWSGNRSALVQGRDGELYKLKGVAWNPQKPSYGVERGFQCDLFGGISSEETFNEQVNSQYYNSRLINEGISPVIKYVGRWVYAAESVYALASISRVKGDTRMDELMYAIDTYLDKIGDNSVATKAGRMVRELYKDFGFIAGRLKQFMTWINLCWGQRLKATNANIGNIVVYRQDDVVRIGLVDFDAAATLESQGGALSLLRRLQQSEFKKIIQSAYDDATSIRFGPADNFDSLDWSFLDFDSPNKHYRDYFVDGFKEGYDCSHSLPIKDSIDGERVTELFKLLKAGLKERK